MGQGHSRFPPAPGVRSAPVYEPLKLSPFSPRKTRFTTARPEKSTYNIFVIPNDSQCGTYQSVDPSGKDMAEYFRPKTAFTRGCCVRSMILLPSWLESCPFHVCLPDDGASGRPGRSSSPLGAHTPSPLFQQNRPSSNAPDFFHEHSIWIPSAPTEKIVSS